MPAHKLVTVPESIRASELLRVSEAAKELTLADKTIWSWIASRRIGAVRLGRAVRVPRSEVLRIIQEGTTPPLGARDL
jgi:excisionase family DNA binding protein